MWHFITIFAPDLLLRFPIFAIYLRGAKFCKSIFSSSVLLTGSSYRNWPFSIRCGRYSGAPNGSVPQNICSSCKFLLAGRCGRNNSPWKESVAGKKIIQGVSVDLKSRTAATGYLYGLLTQDLNWALWNFPVSQVAGCKVAGWELFHQSCWEWGTDNVFPAISQNA